MFGISRQLYNSSSSRFSLGALLLLALGGFSLPPAHSAADSPVPIPPPAPPAAGAMKIDIALDKTEIGMGRSVTLTAQATRPDGQPAAGWTLLPYVNGKRWGAHELADAQGRATFQIPLPMPGSADLQVEAWAPQQPLPEAWIWAPEPKENQTVYLQGDFDLPAKAGKATLWLAVDDSATFYLNGKEAGTAGNWIDVPPRDVTALLQPGKNTLTVTARNGAGPAGLLVRLEAQTPAGPVTRLTDETWRAFTAPPAGWPAPASEPGTSARKIAAFDSSVWGMQGTAWPGTVNKPPLFAGTRLSGDRLAAGAPVSAPARVKVNWRKLQPPPADPAHQIMLQWEPWFAPDALNWSTAQGVPLMGYYWSYLPEVTRQHVIWSIESGVNVFLSDWTNHLWDKKHWDERPEGANAIIHCNTVALEEMARMRDEGIPVPKTVLLLSICNGPSTTMEAINEEMTWIYHNYIRNPRFKDLFLDYRGKPLMVILCGGGPGWLVEHHEIPADETHFTIRWMSSQNDNSKFNQQGYWSWMDGSLEPILTEFEGQPEMLTVCAALFSQGGWKAPTAYGHRSGWTYVESMKAALKSRPAFIQLHQFNEFAGQMEGAGYGEDHNGYYDSYSNELSDDIEPVSLTSPAYRSPQGGWGFFYLNLTRALVDLYRQPADAPQTTVVALSSSLTARELTTNTLALTWTAAGKPATGYTIEVNGQKVASGLPGPQATIDLAPFADGPLKVRLTAEGTQSRYLLSNTEDSLPLAQLVPAYVEVDYTLKRK